MKCRGDEDNTANGMVVDVLAQDNGFVASAGYTVPSGEQDNILCGYPESFHHFDRNKGLVGIQSQLHYRRGFCFRDDNLGGKFLGVEFSRMEGATVRVAVE